MKRRTLLKSALGLALPMANRPGHATTIPIKAESREDVTEVLFSGLPGLDYALGGLSAGELLCIAGPPSSGKTPLLLDLAARICGRYGKNVVF
jgi:replicative DNA helicase